MRCKLIFTFILLALFYGCKNKTVDTDENRPVWKTFSKSNTAGILSDNILTIYISGTGSVWFGSDSGAFYYHSNSWNYPPPDSFNYTVGPNKTVKREISAISEGKSGSMWFGLRFAGSYGIRRMNTIDAREKWQKYNVGSNNIRGIVSYELNSEKIWIATTDGASIYTFTDENDQTKGTLDEIPTSNFIDPMINCVAINQKNGYVYFGMNTGVSYYNINLSSWSNEFLPAGYQSVIRSIAVQYTSNIVWLGKDLGVTSFTPGDTAQHYTTINTGGKLPYGTVNAVMTDFFSTTRWFGTNAGLVQLKNNEWKTFTTDNTPELPSNIIKALYYDYVKKNLWIGTDKGIAVYNESGVQ